MKAQTSRIPDWQRDATQIKTAHVQYWVNGLMAGALDKAEAQQMVTSGEAYVITDQAIGQMRNGQRNG